MTTQSAHRNLPVPAGPRTPVTPAWLVSTAPYAAVIWAYRTLIPARRRANWNHGVSTSHQAMAAVLAPGGGRRAFTHYTTPQLATRRQYGFALAWALFLLVPALRIDQGQSWAN